MGTSILQTFPCHPILQANRVAAVANAIGRSVTLGLGPSHQPLIQGQYGLSYAHPGRNTEEYVQIVAPLLRSEQVDFRGVDWEAHGRLAEVRHPVPVLISAMSPRLLRIAGQFADGTITFLAQAAALEKHVVPRITAAAAAAGRAAPRIVAGLPVAVHDDVAAGRAALSGIGTIFDGLPNYRKIMEIGGYSDAADVAIVGDKKSVQSQVRALIEAGATDVWASPSPVGDDTQSSLQRTRDALRELLD